MLDRRQTRSVNETHENASQVAHAVRTAAAWDVLLSASAAGANESDRGRIRSLLERSVDWEAVLRLADRHGTSSLVFQNLAGLGGVVPAGVLAAVRQDYERNIHKSLFLARELICVLDCLDALGVEAVPYKGVVLSEVYYGDVAMRQAGDIDLFVRKGDVGRIKDAVRELGYTPRVAIPQEAEQHYIAAGYEWSFDSAAGRGLLELQWALQPRFYAVDFDMEGLFERAVKVTVAGREVKTPSAEDLLLVLSVHAAKHVWERLIWLCDIVQILKRERLNWERVQAQARELGIERILHITLLLTHQLLGGAIPAAMVEDRAARALADEIAANMARGLSYEVEQPSYFRLMMRLRERRADRTRFLARLVFTPGPGEWEAVRLPRALFPLYRVVRLVRLAGRLGRR